MSITATSAEVENLLPLVFDLSGDATVEQILNRYPQRLRLAIGDASAWRPNIVGHGRLTMQTTADGHWQMDATFGAGDRWVYPIFRLPADLDLSRFTALVVRVRCERPAKVRVLLHEGPAGVCYLTAEPIVPADGRWHAVAIPLSRFSPSTANAPDPNHHLDLDQVQQISLGLNCDVDQNRLEVSAMYLVDK